MVAIADIPFVRPLAEWIWAADKSDDVSPEICLSLVPFISGGCISQLITKALGVAIILGSCLNKTPIMINIMNSQSASGLSRESLYGEALVYSNGAVYGLLEGHPFTAYGENGALLVQNIIIILMAWQFTANVSLQEKFLAGVAAVIYFFFVFVVLPDDFRYMLMASIWPVLLLSRGSQIVQTYQQKSTGNLSIVTTGLNLCGSLARIGTTMKETGDTTVLFSFIISLSLNFVMFCQYWMYLKNTQKLAAEQKKEKKTRKED
jgi:mannose-P-dolichol utilization defect protein 1